jgi:hypothetical protein
VKDTKGEPVGGAKLRLATTSSSTATQTTSDSDGRFAFLSVSPGAHQLSAVAAGFVEIGKALNLGDSEALTVDLQFTRLAPRTEKVIVTADVTQIDIQHPDPAQQVNVRQDILVKGAFQPLRTCPASFSRRSRMGIEGHNAHLFVIAQTTPE